MNQSQQNEDSLMAVRVADKIEMRPFRVLVGHPGSRLQPTKEPVTYEGEIVVWSLGDSVPRIVRTRPN